MLNIQQGTLSNHHLLEGPMHMICVSSSAYSGYRLSKSAPAFSIPLSR